MRKFACPRYFPVSAALGLLVEIHVASASSDPSSISVGRNAGIAPPPLRTIIQIAAGGNARPRITGPTL